jgi:signal peptidase
VTVPTWSKIVAGWWLLLVVTLTAWAALPAAFGLRPVVVISGSMQPAVDPGDVAVIDPAPGAPRPGGMVLVHDPAAQNQLLLHRVVEVRADGTLITRGDANSSADSTPVPASAIVGRVRFVVPAAGRVAMLAHGPRLEDLGWTALTVAAAVVLIAGARHRRFDPLLPAGV